MEKIKLSGVSTLPPKKLDKKETQERTESLLEELAELQNKLFAQGRYSVLIVLQGMDASGKDGAIKKVFSGLNPMGCSIKSFKKPTEEEMKHDFLWRVHANVPQKGMIQIFNRSHYEDVLIQKVHAWVGEDVIKRRYTHINAFENLLLENETLILKFFLHVSQKEQQERLQERLTDPEKMWKYNANDLEESKLWNKYMEAYENAINFCSSEIPWSLIPADKNWYKEFLISDKIVTELKKLTLEYPKIKQ